MLQKSTLLDLVAGIGDDGNNFIFFSRYEETLFSQILQHGSNNNSFVSHPSIKRLDVVALYLSKLPDPIDKGYPKLIKITEDVYPESFESCKSKILRRLILDKGKRPVTGYSLHNMLYLFCTTQKPWRLTPKWKGFYSLHFKDEQCVDSRPRKDWSGVIQTTALVLRP